MIERRVLKEKEKREREKWEGGTRWKEEREREGGQLEGEGPRKNSIQLLL